MLFMSFMKSHGAPSWISWTFTGPLFMEFMKSRFFFKHYIKPFMGFMKSHGASSWISIIFASWSFIHGCYEVTRFSFKSTTEILFMDSMNLLVPYSWIFWNPPYSWVCWKPPSYYPQGFHEVPLGPPSWISWSPTKFISNQGGFHEVRRSLLTKLMNFMKPPSVLCSWVSKS